LVRILTYQIPNVLQRLPLLMGIITRLFQSLNWRKSEPRPLALESSPFGRLPLELIFKIASDLPLESAASLSLTCFTLHSCLEKQYLQALKRADRRVIYKFLHLLERDLPEHLLCQDCNAFQSIALAERHVRGQRVMELPLKCWLNDASNEFYAIVHPAFSSTIFRMAMKSHRLNKDSSDLIKLLSYDPVTVAEIGFVKQTSAIAKIKGDSLLIRDQQIFMVPSAHDFPIPWYEKLRVCRHIIFWSMRCLYIDGIKVPHKADIGGHENKEGIIYCEYCYTEFQIDFKSYGEFGNAMFVTRWMDLGEGQDPDHYKWRSRLNDFMGRVQREVTFQRGSICTSFEGIPHSDFKFDSLLATKDEHVLKTTIIPPGWPYHLKKTFDLTKQYNRVEDGRLIDLRIRPEMTIVWEVSFNFDY
jgi:hypothetical protein